MHTQSSYTKRESFWTWTPKNWLVNVLSSGLHILHKAGHFSPQKPMHWWSGLQVSIFLQGKRHGSLLQGCEQSLVHLECSHRLMQGSLQAMQTTEQAIVHEECLHNVTHFLSMHGEHLYIEQFSLHRCPQLSSFLHILEHPGWPLTLQSPHIAVHLSPQGKRKLQ